MALTGFELLVVALAACRLSALFTEERGPGDIFLRIRKKIGITHDDNGEVFGVPPGSLPYLFTCFWCFSMCLALPISILLYFCKEVTLWALLPFAISAGAIFLKKDR